MSQHDFIIDDQAGASFLVDLNANLAAIVSNNSGASEPAVTYAFQWWADTTTDILKIRNESNNAWINVFDLAAGVILLADNAVTTSKLVDGVLSANAAGRAKMADSFVTAAKIADGAITLVKLASIYGTSGANKLLQLDAAGKLPPLDGSQLTNLPSAGSGTLRAWVNFNGTGTVAIRASGNVSSVTDNGNGNYTVNFTTAMPDVNYAVVGNASASGTTPRLLNHRDGDLYSTTQCQMRVQDTRTAGDYTDSAVVTMAFFR